MKKWKSAFRAALLSSAGLFAIPVHCNSIFAKRTAPPDDEYEYVSVAGTRIPQKVKKGTAPVTGDSTSDMSAEEFRRMQQRNQRVGKLPGGS